MRRSHWIWIGAAALAAVALAGGDAMAKKGGGGGKPGGGGGEPGNTTPLDIAYTLNHGQWAMQDDGSGGSQLTGAKAYKASWSPDGTQMAFWGDGFGSGQGPGIYVIDSDGTNLTRVASVSQTYHVRVAWCPVAAPDGSHKVAFTDVVDLGGGQSGFDVFFVNADGTGRVNATSGVRWGGTRINLRASSWSPDGDRILCAAGGSLDAAAILEFVYDTNGDLVLPTSLTAIPSSTTAVGDGEWAKTGDAIVYSKGVGSPVLGDLFELDISDLSDVPAPVNITNTPDLEELWPSWSPDDSEVVCVAAGDILAYDVSNGDSRRLLRSKGRNAPRHPSWKRSPP